MDDRPSWLRTYSPRRPFLQPGDFAVSGLWQRTGKLVCPLDNRPHRARVHPPPEFGVPVGERKTAGATVVVSRQILIVIFVSVDQQRERELAMVVHARDA